MLWGKFCHSSEPHPEKALTLSCSWGIRFHDMTMFILTIKHSLRKSPAQRYLPLLQLVVMLSQMNALDTKYHFLLQPPQALQKMCSNTDRKSWGHEKEDYTMFSKCKSMKWILIKQYSLKTKDYQNYRIGAFRKHKMNYEKAWYVLMVAKVSTSRALHTHKEKMGTGGKKNQPKL